MHVIAKDLEFTYQKGTPLAYRALHEVNVSLSSGKFIAIIGHTGSGKSTFLQHLNGLLIPTDGLIKIGEKEIKSSKAIQDLKFLRKQVGVVFQFSEQQLFGETVEKDICFGPMNFGISEVEAKLKAKESIKIVGLDEEVLQKSPFELSGGQMRRVAIAGILAMHPEMLVLDEPTAGLDPSGSRMIMEMFKKMHIEQNLTIVLVTHNMDDVAMYADEVVVFSEGTAALSGTPKEIFADFGNIKDLGLDVPNVVKLQRKFEEISGSKLSELHLNIETLASEIAEVTKKVRTC